MRYASLALFLVAAILCFVAGYKVGKKSQPTRAPVVATEIIVQKAPLEPLTDTPELPQLVAELPKDELFQ